MGVTAYVTRRALPGAAPTARLGVRRPVAVSPAGAAARDVPAKGRGKTGASAPEELRRMLAPREGVNTKPPVNEQSANVRQTGKTAPQAARAVAERFRLAVLVCADRLWLEELGEGAIAREQVELVSAIGRALKHPEKSPPARVGQFDWPMHDNGQLDLGAVEAAASLQGYLGRQLDDHQCVTLCCLGEPAHARIKGLSLPCATQILPSTRELIESPLRKRELWERLSQS